MGAKYCTCKEAASPTTETGEQRNSLSVPYPRPPVDVNLKEEAKVPEKVENTGTSGNPTPSDADNGAATQQQQSAKKGGGCNENVASGKRYFEKVMVN